MELKEFKEHITNFPKGFTFELCTILILQIKK